MKYKLTKPFKEWKVGDEIDEYQYKRLPDEFKKNAVPVEQKAKVINKIMKYAGTKKTAQ